MPSYEDRIVKIGVHCSFPRLISKTKSVTPQFFLFLFCYLTAAKVCKKICVVKDFRANVLKSCAAVASKSRTVQSARGRR